MARLSPQLASRLPHLLIRAVLPLLAACSTPYHPPQVLDGGAAFPGLIDIAARSPQRAADVLMVHGMCSHDTGWAHATVELLLRPIAANAARGSTGAASAAGEEQVLVVPETVATPAGLLRFDGLIWSPLTQRLKQQLCYDQTNKTPACQGQPPFAPARARLNALGKDGLIDDCLPDALIYQGVARDTIQQRMRAAVLRALAGGGADDEAPLVVIAESMGSKILFDTLLRMSEEPAGSPAAALAQRTLDRMRYLVMAGNQIPMLSLADQTLAAAPLAAPFPPGPDSLQLLLQKRRAGRRGTGAADRQLTLVAFTDPNDLLSYTLQTAKYASEGVSVYNVLVSNAPTFLGLLELPDAAHLDYLANPDVGRLIACGLPASALCR